MFIGNDLPAAARPCPSGRATDNLAQSPEAHTPALPPPPPRYTLGDVVALVPQSKRSQVELLVRTGTVTPAWPSPGTGHEREFDFRNVFELAVAAELIALGFTGQRLTAAFRHIVGIILDPRNAADQDYLVLLPHSAGGGPLPLQMCSQAGLASTVGVFSSATR